MHGYHNITKFRNEILARKTDRMCGPKIPVELVKAIPPGSDGNAADYAGWSPVAIDTPDAAIFAGGTG